MTKVRRFQTISQCVFDSQSTVIIFDQRLLEVSDAFRAWIRKQKKVYPVKAGEKLKSLDKFPQHCAQLANLAKDIPSRKMTVVSIGGGSVGDFSGFFASCFKRGVRLVHIPSTWLAAIDSAHGGKTALNLAGVKNQIGSFYSASEVILVQDLLLSQPSLLAADALSEVLKIGLIKGGKCWSTVQKIKQSDYSQSAMTAQLWLALPELIAAKMSIVKKDPQEKKGVRAVLNLGHTFGHVLESHLRWTHGKSIGHGLHFALELSHAKGLLDSKLYGQLVALLADQFKIKRLPQYRIPIKKLKELMLKDKKQLSSGKVQFVLLQKLGRVVQTEISINDVVLFAVKSKWAQK